MSAPSPLAEMWIACENWWDGMDFEERAWVLKDSYYSGYPEFSKPFTYLPEGIRRTIANVFISKLEDN